VEVAENMAQPCGAACVAFSATAAAFSATSTVFLAASAFFQPLLLSATFLAAFALFSRLKHGGGGGEKHNGSSSAWLRCVFSRFHHVFSCFRLFSAASA
jgi:hypothetical protein